MTEVHLSLDEYVATVRFANPPVNYFTERLLTSLADTMERAAAEGARAIVLRADGRHFCAGADFSSIGDSLEDRAAAARSIYTAGLRLFDQPLPIVAAIQGAAIGGGLGLACVADFRVVTSTSRLAANFSRLGFHPGFGLSATFPMLVGHQRAAELLYTSRPVSGSEAVAIGLADRLADDNALEVEAVHLAREIAAAAPLAVQSIKATHRHAIRQEVKEVLEREFAEQRRLWSTEDARIGLRAAKVRTQPVFLGR
ncbi:enoyl-CoA hydratase/isomerase family protein [Actinomadura madurae]|uniref:enoyl-CoA hydratase/isomerase family protein n=1 Tax=Actinomadura madurae TaxID=1993 RepID=UPI000D841B49|nr:enoyl-CoA hydratase/isomerase family protein [Actinomadura madurae]SPT51270.1 Cyclohexa-1,5-dienecarbonyl-CoA hydratase [Actinomadura madurae]